MENGFWYFISYLKEISKDTKVIILAPPIITESIENNFFKNLFDKNSIENSKELPKICKNIAKKYMCDFIDLNKLVSVSNIDGLHLSIEAHNKIGQFLIKYIEDNFKY